MDPEENLREQLWLARSLVEAESPKKESAQRLAELVLALDEWLRKGGVLPRTWAPWP